MFSLNTKIIWKSMAKFFSLDFYEAFDMLENQFVFLSVDSFAHF